jgi:ribonuclease T1
MRHRQGRQAMQMRSIRYCVIAAVFAVLTAALLAPPMVVARENDASLAAVKEIAVAALPREAQQTLRLIRKGGPYPYERDGVVFGNFERLLPPRNRGYYHEYTVPTPGARSRGARRIIAGQTGEYYYTDDHYRSFRRIRE